MIWGAVLAAVVFAVFTGGGSSEREQMRKVGCELMAAWEMVGNDPNALDVPTLGALIAAKLDPKDERPELDVTAVEVAQELIAKGGC